MRTIRNAAVVMVCLSLAIGTYAQKNSSTAKAMEKQGMVNIKGIDPTIEVSLMYSRPDNFTGTVLYTDLHEAYLHPAAANALKKAQA